MGEARVIYANADGGWLLDVDDEGPVPVVRADRVQQWQPIETAPDKDMECDIWVYVPPHATGNGIAAQTCAFRLDGCWVESWSGNTIHPTYWQPLPAPPPEPTA